MRGQLLGGRKTISSSLVVEYQTLFDGNLEERRGNIEFDEGAGDTGHADDDSSGILLTINRLVSDYGTGVISTLFSQARVTWGAGRGGGGNNQKLVDIGAGGTVIYIGATNYLKVEVAHVAIKIGLAPTPCIADFELSWVRACAAGIPDIHFTSRIGPVADGTRSARFPVPPYAHTGRIFTDGVPNAGDLIGFYQSPAGGVLFYEAFGAAPPSGSVDTPIAAGAEYFDVTNTVGTGAAFNYIVVWELR